jgi:hypothetical protein
VPNTEAATGVERDALADQHRGRCRLGRALVVHHDQPRRLDAAVGHRQERAHAQLLDRLAVMNLDAQAELLAQLLRLLAEVGRGADVARQVAEALGQFHAIGQRHTLRQCALGLRIACRQQQRDLGQARAALILLALQLVGAKRRLARRHRQHPGLPARVAALDRPVGRSQCHHAHAAAGIFNGRFHRVAVGTVGQFAGCAETGQHHAWRGHALQVTQHHHVAALARGIATLDGCLQCAAADCIDTASRGTQRSVAVDADSNCVGLDCLGRGDLRDKFHRDVSLACAVSVVRAALQNTEPAERDSQCDSV